MKMDFSDQRVSYEKSMLDESSLPTDAFVLLHQWIQTAIDKQVNEPYAMSLATCGDDSMPSVRIVLMREITENGLVFYTNYLSAKAQDMLENPHAEVLFFWHELERQIRIRGTIKKLSEAQSDAYFHKRPHDSQLAAWVSQPQSGVVESRDVMEQKFTELKAEYPDDAVVPRPEFWGGYELLADEIEFWQGRANRMHDRIVYQRQSAQGSGWHIERRLP